MKTDKISQQNPEHAKYRYIRAWGVLLRSYEYYIKAQQAQAAEDGAPIDAIYKNAAAQEWYCASELSADHEVHKIYKQLFPN